MASHQRSCLFLSRVYWEYWKISISLGISILYGQLRILAGTLGMWTERNHPTESCWGSPKVSPPEKYMCAYLRLLSIIKQQPLPHIKPSQLPLLVAHDSHYISIHSITFVQYQSLSTTTVARRASRQLTIWHGRIQAPGPGSSSMFGSTSLAELQVQIVQGPVL